MKRIVLTIFISGFLLTVSTLFLLYKGYLRFNYPSSNEFPVQGIDISHHQGNINWMKLMDEDISFVYMKATEGGDYVDPKFDKNWVNSKNNGLPTGAYHFYRLCKNGVEQAENFIRVVPNESNSLPPVIDLEFGGNCETDKSKDQILREVQDFIDLLAGHYGKTPMIYATKEFYKEYLLNHFSESPIWIRDIFSKPELKDKTWTFWQFANRGHLNGIDTYVDINVFNGTPDDFEKFAGTRK